MIFHLVTLRLTLLRNLIIVYTANPAIPSTDDSNKVSIPREINKYNVYHVFYRELNHKRALDKT